MTSKLVGTSSATRTLDQRDLAALRPMPAPRPRAPRKPSERPVVSSGIVCFCGERFAESQALEFMLHLRAEVGEVLDWNKRFRENLRARHRKYAAKPEVLKRRAAQARLRMQENPEARDRKNERLRQSRARKRAEREEAGS